MRSTVADVVDLRRIGEHTVLLVAAHRIPFPRAFPQLVEHGEVFVGVVVAGIVFELIDLTHVAGCSGQIAGDDIPSDPATRQVVERRQPPGERIRMLESGARGDTKPEVFGGVGHRRDEQQRIGHRDLGALPDRRFVGAGVHVVGAQHVGDEQPVETATFERLRQFNPVVEGVVVPRPVVGMTPHTWRLMGYAVHVERVEPDLAGHSVHLPRAVAGQFLAAHGPRETLGITLDRMTN